VTGRLLGRVLAIVLDPGMALTCLAAACLYAQCSSMDSLAPMLLQDTTEFDDGDVSMASSAFPAGLGAALLVAAPIYANMALRRRKFAFELSVQTLGLAGALMALVAVQSASDMPAVMVACLFLLSFGGGLTYYVTLNLYPLTYGEDCATASAFLDVVGLLSSTVFQLVAGVIFHEREGEEQRQSWNIVLLILSALVLVAMACTLVLGCCPLLTRERPAGGDQGPQVTSCDTECSLGSSTGSSTGSAPSDASGLDSAPGPAVEGVGSRDGLHAI
jgi:MFS family permease